MSLSLSAAEGRKGKSGLMRGDVPASHIKRSESNDESTTYVLYTHTSSCVPCTVISLYDGTYSQS